MKKTFVLLIVSLFLVGCDTSYRFTSRLQNEFFDQNGKRAGMSGSLPCVKQALRETGHDPTFGICSNDPKCVEMADICMKEKGFIQTKSFETTEERMALYREVYEKNLIKQGMTRLEVVDILGAPQITTFQVIPPRKLWIYCRSAAKTALIGYNFTLTIIWVDDKVERMERRFHL